MPIYTVKTTDKTYHLYFKGDNHARDSARCEANHIGSGVRVFDGLGRLLWNEQPDDSPYRTANRHSNQQNDSVF